MKKKDEAKVLGIAMVIIAWINLLVSVVNISLNNAMLRGSICGTNIVLMTLCLVRFWVVDHNFKVELKEIRKLQTKLGFREDFDPLNRWQLKKKIRGYEVSTVDLGIDHNPLSEGEPLYYETMIFDTKDEENRWSEIYLNRYSTKKEAKKGHKEAIKYIKEKLKEGK